MSTFATIENTLKDLFTDNLANYNVEVVKSGNPQEAFRNALRLYPDNARWCIFEVQASNPHRKGLTFSSRFVWDHRVTVELYIPVKSSDNTQQIEDDTRTDYDAFLSLISANRALFAPTNLLRVERAHRPTPQTIANQKFMRLVFVLVVTEII